MIIDIKPTLVRPANNIEKEIMQLYNYKELYYIGDRRGVELSVKWDEKQIKQFAPNSVLSEKMLSWQIENLKTIIKSKRHPTLTETIQVKTRSGISTGNRDSKGYLIYTPIMKTEIVAARLTKQQLIQFKNELNNIQTDKKSTLNFVKVVPHLKDGKETNANGLTAKQFADELYNAMLAEGLPISNYQKLYHFTKPSTKSVIEYGLWHGSKTPKQLAKGYGKAWEYAYS